MAAKPAYVTVETVRAAMDITEPTSGDRRILAAIRAATDAVKGINKRQFWPTRGVKKFDWPNPQRQTVEPWRVDLYQNDLWELAAASSGGVTMDIADLLFEPNWDGPPYTSVQVALDSGTMWTIAGTFQQAVSLTGLWGYLGSVDTLTTLTSGATSSAATLSLGPTAECGIGAMIGVDDELMTVTGKASAATGATITADIGADTTATLIAVSSLAAVTIGETITIGSERMLVEDITSGLLVQRAVEGTTLAAHTTGAGVWAYRTWTVERGAFGSTAAAHLTSAAVSRYRPPALIEEYALAHTLHTLQQQRQGYVGVVRQGQETSGHTVTDRALVALEQQIYGTFGRQARTRAV